MCNQGFAHFQCGHTRLYETPCDFAEGIPLYIKVACPDYSMQQASAPSYCGSGGRFCHESLAGQIYDRTHTLCAENLQQLQDDHARMQLLLGETGTIKQTFDAQKLFNAMHHAHPAQQHMAHEVQKLVQRRGHLIEQRRAFNAILDTMASQHYGPLQSDRVGSADALSYLGLSIDAFATLPRELQLLISGGIDPQMVIDSQTQIQSRGGTASLAPVGSIAVLPVDHRSTGIRQNAPGLRPPARIGGAHQTSWPTPNQNHTPKSANGPLQNDTKHLSSAKSNKIDEAPLVRRSTRVRDKKINYAESEASTILSSRSSPEKYEDDASSPPKSDFSTSPERTQSRRKTKIDRSAQDHTGVGERRLEKVNTSLSGMIEEWKRRNKSAISGTSQRLQASGIDYDAHSLQAATEQGRLQASSNNAGQAYANVASKPQSATIQRQRSFKDMPLQSFMPPPNYVQTPSRERKSPYGLSFSTPLSMIDMPTVNYHAGSQIMHNLQMPTLQSTLQGSSAIDYTAVPHEYSHRPWSAQRPATQPSMRCTTAQHSDAPDYRHPMYEQSHGSNQMTPSEVQRVAACPSFAKADYAHLRHSFSATADLSPSVPNDYSSPIPDPQKRSLPVSSPLLSNKRQRLSLPGDDANSASRSSPVKMPSYDSRWMHEHDHQPVIPAPVMTPIKITYGPAASNSHNEPSDSALHYHLGASELDNDIDWSHLDQSLLEVEIACQDGAGIVGSSHALSAPISDDGHR